MNKIHIMHIIPSLEVGGMENGVVNLAKGICRKNFRLSICCLSKVGVLASRLPEDVKVINMAQGSGKALSLAFRLARILRAEHVDIVHTHNDYAGIYGVAAAKLAGVPVVVHGEHGATEYTTGHRKLLKKFVCRIADRITTVSEGLKEDVSNYWDVPPSKVLALLNGVDRKKFSANGLQKGIRDLTEPDRDSVVIGTVGRLSGQKDYFLLLEAMSMLLEQVVQAKLIFVGDGPLRLDLERKAKELGIAGHVFFLGERDDVPDLLTGMDLFVLPSYRDEGLPNCVLEAMSVGLPVVASDIKGIPEVVVHRVTGLLFPARNRSALFDAMLCLAQNAAMRKQFAEAGFNRVKELFSIEKMISNYENFYAKLAERIER